MREAVAGTAGAGDELDVQRTRLMLQAVPEGILLFEDGRCVDQNAGAVALAGVSNRRRAQRGYIVGVDGPAPADLQGYPTGGELRGCIRSRIGAERQVDGGGIEGVIREVAVEASDLLA